MPGIPEKAYRLAGDKVLTKVKRIDDGSHELWFVTFEEDGAQQEGYLKMLEPNGHFPELLAKISVATSSLLGGPAAKERLVFDEYNNIAGIVSLRIPGFNSFNYAYEKPKDDIEKELVVPSTETLIEHNIMEVLFPRFFSLDDDTHAHNLGLKRHLARRSAAHLDFDMTWNEFTVYMKGGRPGIAYPKPWIDLTVLNYERFPCLVTDQSQSNHSLPYHWPTFAYPGQGSIPSVLPESVQTPVLLATLPKTYPEPDKFVALAASPVAQEQKVVAALKILLTFQPEIMRKRLSELFDTSPEEKMPLNYTCLPLELQKIYEEKFPTLCNETTNKEPFVDFMMKLYQMHYDNLYRVVVFYMGTENNGFGVPLLATNEDLYKKPSFYTNIRDWVIAQNKEDPNNQYNLDELEKRYHKIWRDSYTLRLKTLLRDAHGLTSEITKLATADGKIKGSVTKEITDNSLTCSWQLLGELQDITIDLKILVPEKSPLYQAYVSLIDFTNQFQRIVKTYYEKEFLDLADDDSNAFAMSLEDLCRKYEFAMGDYLKHTTSHADKFAHILKELRQLAQQINFKRHLLTNDKQMLDMPTSIPVKKVLLPVTHPDVIAQFKEALFGWVDSLSSEKFNLHINEAIDKKYESLISLRYRAKSVKEYLLKSNESNRNKLAYILTSGTTEDGALNKAIIQEVAPHVLQTNYMPSVSSAIKEGRFEENIGLFVKAAANFAKEDDVKLIHLYNSKGIDLFYRTLYHWVSEISWERVNNIVNAALLKYEQGLSATAYYVKIAFWGGTPTRKEEIQGYFHNHPPAMALAKTFMNGDKSSTACEQLLLGLVREMKKDMMNKPELKKDPGYNLIDLFNETENKTFYLQHKKNNLTRENSLEKNDKSIEVNTNESSSTYGYA